MNWKETKILVIGSVNLDLLVYVDSFPHPGQTLQSRDFKQLPGGKGLNLARTLYAMGTPVKFVAAVGHDTQFEELKDVMGEDHPLLKGIVVKNEKDTGTAMIMVNNAGENEIIVSSGANMDLKFEDIPPELFHECHLLVMCLETDVTLAMKCFTYFKSLGKTTVLNVSPSGRITNELKALADFLILNHHELQDLHQRLKITSEEQVLSSKEQTIVLTLGKEGVKLIRSGYNKVFPSFQVSKVVDTTGAGDSFLGGFLSEYLRSNKDIEKAIMFGQRVAAVKIGHKGATIPRHDYESIMKAPL